MKKIIAALLLVGMIFSFASCVNTNNEDNSTTTASSSSEETQNGGETTVMTAEEVLGSLYVPFLTNAMTAFGVSTVDEVKIYFVGTEMETITETDSETGESFSYEMPKSAPSVLSLEDVDVLTSMTYFPAESVSKLQDAAIFYNMMNMNTGGTYSAFSFANEEDVQAMAAQMKNIFENNHWSCGFPDGYLLMSVDNVLLSVFGANDFLTAFKDAVSSTYVESVVLFEGAIM